MSYREEGRITSGLTAHRTWSTCCTEVVGPERSCEQQRGAKVRLSRGKAEIEFKRSLLFYVRHSGYRMKISDLQCGHVSKRTSLARSDAGILRIGLVRARRFAFGPVPNIFTPARDVRANLELSWFDEWIFTIGAHAKSLVLAKGRMVFP